MTLLKTTDGCTSLSQCQLAKPSNFIIVFVGFENCIFLNCQLYLSKWKNAACTTSKSEEKQQTAVHTFASVSYHRPKRPFVSEWKLNRNAFLQWKACFFGGGLRDMVVNVQLYSLSYRTKLAILVPWFAGCFALSCWSHRFLFRDF